jgi:uncharacterized membrane protein HdeD (DUF308 family)
MRLRHGFGERAVRASGAALFALGAIAMVAPVFSREWGVLAIGLALLVAGIVEFAVAWFFRNYQVPYFSAMVSIVAGGSIFFQSSLVFSGVMATTSVLLAIDAAFRIRRGLQRQGAIVWNLLNGVTNLGLAALVFALRNRVGAWGFGLLLGARIAASGWEAWFAPERSEADEFDDIEDIHPDAALGLEPHPIIGVIHREAMVGYPSRELADFYWSMALIVVFFAIHVGRLRAEWTWLGMISPASATAGDLLISFVVALMILRPVELVWRWLTRPIERLVWQRILEDRSPAEALAVAERLTRSWTEQRLRRLVYRDRENNTLYGAIRQTVRGGLALTAVLIAVNPIWGFSWFFNTENWATGVWQRITETRVDIWRAAMIDAVAKAAAADVTSPQLFALSPGTLPDNGDFSFIVVGDPGEGDSSQHALRDQLILTAREERVKFLAIASDVVYPSGQMRDYEANFYLPLKGITKPVYAIPGNHDWYNALDGFAANLMRPDAARLAMRARVDADFNVSSTTDARVEALIAEAARLRSLYHVNAAHQTGPFFEIHSPGFSLIAVDTGILRRIDDRHAAWLRSALDRSQGTFTMALLGHPLFAAGAYQPADDEGFQAVHDILRHYHVPLVMAGDTHDFEYYREAGTHHFVNGGGGAYLSIGTALAFPASPPVADFAFYPNTASVRAKLNAETPLWKWPAWWWVRHYGAWPFSVEALSAVFDFNHAPFFQSFMEVRVERSANRVRLWLYGVDGRLTWGDLQTGGAAMPTNASPGDPVEFVIPMP